MNPLLTRIIILLLALPLIPYVVNGVAGLVVRAINRLSLNLNNLLEPLSHSGEAGFQSALKLCLYLVVFILIAKFLIRR